MYPAKTYPANGYDLVCLHDMRDPVGVLKHMRETLAADGTCMLVERSLVIDWRTTSIRLGACFSWRLMVCTPASLDQEVSLALGEQAGEA